MDTSNPVIFRRAEEKDLPELLHLMKAHADFEQLDFTYDHQEDRLKEKIFHASEPLHCIVVESQGRLIGYATCIRQYATWDADYYLYLDCLYFEASFRGKGLGSTMMQHIKDLAKSLDCRLVQWHTPPFNTPAIEFYHKQGAVSKSKERFFWNV